MRIQFLSFGERLKYLMENKGITSGTELASALYSGGFSGKQGKDISSKEAVSNMARSINLHLKKTDALPLSVEWIDRYCRFFRCSADFLLGYIDQTTHCATDICSVTGLTEESITVLKYCNVGGSEPESDARYNKGNLDGLNYILSLAAKQIRQGQVTRKDNYSPNVHTVLLDIYDYINTKSVVITGHTCEVERIQKEIWEQQGRPLSLYEPGMKIDTVGFSNGSPGGAIGGVDVQVHDAKLFYEMYLHDKLWRAIDRLKEQAEKEESPNGND